MARLTERGVQAAKPGRHSDGDGLHLVVSEAGRKKWVLRYQVAGVRKDKGLGAYPAVGLKDARERTGVGDNEPHAASEAGLLEVLSVTFQIVEGVRLKHVMRLQEPVERFAGGKTQQSPQFRLG